MPLQEAQMDYPPPRGSSWMGRRCLRRGGWRRLWSCFQANPLTPRCVSSPRRTEKSTARIEGLR